MAAGGSLSFLTGLRQRPIRLDPAVLRRQLAGVDEVLQLLLVLVGVAVGRVAEDAALLDEILKRRARISSRAEAKLARGFGHREGAAPAEQVKELRRKECDACLTDRKRFGLTIAFREPKALSFIKN